MFALAYLVFAAVGMVSLYLIAEASPLEEKTMISFKDWFTELQDKAGVRIDRRAAETLYLRDVSVMDALVELTK